MPVRPAFPVMLSGVVAFTVLAGCSGNSRGSAGDNEPGQLITAETIRKSGLSTGWDVLRTFGEHLSFGEHERGPVRVSRRGRESVYLSESPLLVIDGVKVRDFRVLTTLPARDIESMRILSGSEGSARHGLFAASGAIIVKTMYSEPAVSVADTTNAD